MCLKERSISKDHEVRDDVVISLNEDLVRFLLLGEGYLVPTSELQNQT
jgi:hypothetical protein